MTDNPPEATPLWYQRMVRQFEDERQAHLYARQILRDLIAELREIHNPLDRGDGFVHCRYCGPLTLRWPCETSRELDRAEARLREVTSDE